MRKKLLYLSFLIGVLIAVPVDGSLASELKANVGLMYTEHPKELLINQVESVVSPKTLNQKADVFKLKVGFSLTNQESSSEKLKNKVKALFDSEAHELMLELAYQNAAGDFIQLETQKQRFDYTTEGNFTKIFEVDFKQLQGLEKMEASVDFKVTIYDDSASITYLNSEIQQKIFFPTMDQQEMHIYQQKSENELLYRGKFSDEEVETMILPDGVAFPQDFVNEETKQEWLVAALRQGKEHALLNNKTKIGAKYTASYAEAEGLSEKQIYLYEYSRLFCNLMSITATSGYGFAPQLTLLYATDKIDPDLAEEQIPSFQAQILLNDGSDFEAVQLKKSAVEGIMTSKAKLKEKTEQELLLDRNFASYTIKTLFLPDVNVEKYSGSILSETAASRSISGIVQGGGKLYFKFWPEEINHEKALSYQLVSVGINQRTIMLGTSYKIVGYMYNHLNSDSTSQDKFLLSPYNEESNLLSGWSSAERKWLKQK